MGQKGQKDPRSLLGNATGRDEPGCREGLSGRSGKGDDAASPRLAVVATRDSLKGQAGRLAARYSHSVGKEGNSATFVDGSRDSPKFSGSQLIVVAYTKCSVDSLQRGAYFGKRISAIAPVRAPAGGGVCTSPRLTLTTMVAFFSGKYHIAVVKPGI